MAPTPDKNRDRRILSYISERRVGPVPSQRLFADALGISKSTLQSAIKRLERDAGCEHDKPAPRPERPAEDERIISQLRDDVKSLKRERDEAFAAANDYDAIKQIIGGIAAAPVEPPAWLLEPPNKFRSPHIPMMIWSDWHAGEVVSRSETNGMNEFNSAIMERRARTLVSKTIDLCQNHGPGQYPGVIVNLLGDFISGALHPELAKTDDKSSIESALHVRDILVWGITELAKVFPKLYIPCTAGNHGRNTHKPEFKRTVFQNFDWLIYQMLARHFENNKSIVFDISEANEVHYQVFGRRYLAMHGDMLGVKGGDGIIGSLGPIMRGELKVGRQHSAFGRDYDCLLMGHWHQQLWLPRVIVSNSLKGFDEYASRALRAPPSVPSQPLWFVNQRYGQVINCEVYLEEKPQNEHSTSWVTWTTAKK
jgi:hypothetical protein